MYVFEFSPDGKHWIIQDGKRFVTPEIPLKLLKEFTKLSALAYTREQCGYFKGRVRNQETGKIIVVV